MTNQKAPPANELGGQPCPMCNQKTLTLMERMVEVPFFGNMFIFSMSCSNCKYLKSDVEATEQKSPSKYTYEISSEDDLSVRVVKSSGATIKIPHVGTIESGPASNGYVTNLEGIVNRMKVIIEKLKEDAEDSKARKRAKNLLKKLQNVLWGREKLKIIIEDKTGNSAIISEKAVKSALKK